MQVERGDPRYLLSRRHQDFHEGDPATQAAIRGEEYFEITAGHLLSSALESDCFETVEECLDFFGLERDVLKRKEPFDRWEIKDFEDRIYKDADERLREGEEIPYEAWAEWVIGEGSLWIDEVPMVIEELLQSAATRQPDEAASERADKIDEAQSRYGGYHADILRMQTARLLELLERDGFAITVDAAAKSFIASGLLEPQPADDYIDLYIESVVDELKKKLAVAAYQVQRQEVEDGVINLRAFNEEEWEQRFLYIDDQDFSYWAQGSYPIVLGCKELRLFASHYAASMTSEAMPKDEKYQKLMDLIKNTPERIAEIQGHIADLRESKDEVKFWRREASTDS